MGALRSRNKAVSALPKQFHPYLKGGLERVEGLADDPLGGISDIYGELGIKPGVKADPAALEGVSATRGTLPMARDLFRSGGGQQLGTIGGDYLDVAGVPAYQRLEAALRNTGAGTFEELMDRARQGAARSGTFRSSAREAAEANAAAKVSSDIADTLARAGMQQYGAERGLQEGASARGLGLLPDVAQQLFGQGLGLTNIQIQDLMSRISAAQGAQGLRDNPLSILTNLLGAAQGQLTQQPRGGQLALSALKVPSLFGGE